MKLKTCFSPQLKDGTYIHGLLTFPLEIFSDDRGALAEFFRTDHVAVKNRFIPEMGYVSWTLPGKKRGPHEHKYQSDYFAFISGSFDLHLWENRGEVAKLPAEDRHIIMPNLGGENPMAVIIPPGVVHGYVCKPPDAAIIINIPDALYKGRMYKAAIDEIRHEDDQNSVYKILDLSF
jgi:dTDP-4-dehydrorhamnose 3,5-epimerase